MSKALKFQWLIDKMNLSHACPYNECIERKIKAYRFTFSSINHSDNFLPKIIFDEKHNIPPRRNSADTDFQCSCCALSMFDSYDAAKTLFDGFPDRIKIKFGYTHIAEGEINEDMGRVSEVKSGHFDLFEYEEVALEKTFQIIGQIK